MSEDNFKNNSYKNQPTDDGKFGNYGGMFVAETLMPLILDVSNSYKRLKNEVSFRKKLQYYQEHYIGRPSPLYFAKRITEYCGGAKIYFKRDELNHTGAHKINNVIGQALLAKEMGKSKIIAETGAGQHGVATATVCALFNMDCEVFMGEEDIERQKPNVERMQLLGAKIIPVTSGTGTLKDAMNEALRHWVSNAKTHFYIIGTVAGPHPYPMMVRDFQSIIGEEAKKQIIEAEKSLPDKLIACIGGGSNAMGLFYPFLDDKVKITGAGIYWDEYVKTDQEWLISHTGYERLWVCTEKLNLDNYLEIRSFWDAKELDRSNQRNKTAGELQLYPQR